MKSKKPDRRKQRKQSYATLKLRKALGRKGGVLLARGEWAKNRPAHLAEIENKRTSSKARRGLSPGVMEDTYKAIVVRSSEGLSAKEIGEEFGLTHRTIQALLTRKFIDNKKGAEVLRSLLLENALQLGAQTRMKADSMNGMQSAVATGIMVSKFIELDKHQSGKPQDVDMAALSEIGRELKDLNRIVNEAGIETDASADELDDDD